MRPFSSFESIETTTRILNQSINKPCLFDNDKDIYPEVEEEEEETN